MTERELEGVQVGFIGCGAMAQALAGGLVEAGLAPDRLLASDPFPAARARIETALGIKAVEENAEVVARSDVVVIAVKPGLVASTLKDLDPAICERPLWISIAAGVSLGQLRQALPAAARVVRTMPNTPALVGAGATAYFPGPGLDETDLARVEAVLRAAGWCWRAPNEALLDAVTGLSGSGPAYVFLILEALADAGVRQGLPRDVARELATRTVLGAAKLALETGTHPGALKDQVTSPGGTTIAGIAQIESHGVRAAFYDAVAAAADRSRALRDD
ncbi:MAG: pyrroline-5-carboxylate reductase [bacterium]